MYENVSREIVEQNDLRLIQYIYIYIQYTRYMLRVR